MTDRIISGLFLAGIALAALGIAAFFVLVYALSWALLLDGSGLFGRLLGLLLVVLLTGLLLIGTAIAIDEVW